jgi:hypothetical protein
MQTALGSTTIPHYTSALQAARHFAICDCTLSHWERTRADFPKRERVAEKTTLFNLAAIEQYLRRSSN